MNVKRKSYLLANASFYPSAGGVETTLRGMAEALVKDGHEVIVVSGNRANTTSQPQKEHEILFGAEIYRYKVLPFFLYYITATLLLRKINRDKVFDGVISRSYTTTICLWLAGYKNIKYVAPASYSLQNHPKFMSGNKVKKYVSYFINAGLERLSILLLKEVFVFSSEMEKQIKRLSKDKKINKVFPGVDRGRFRPVSASEKASLRERYSVPADKKVLLFIGRAEKVKNSLDVIQVLTYLPDDFIAFYVGEGSEKNVAVELSLEKGLQDRVRFYDFTNRPEEFFQLSDAFLMTSVYEPFGQVILEALSCGAKVFGYISSGTVKTATSEIFETLGVDAKRYLCDKERGLDALAYKIKRGVGNDEGFESGVYGWNEFVYRIR